MQTLNVNTVCIAASGAPPVRSGENAACSLTSDPLGAHDLAAVRKTQVACPAPGVRPDPSGGRGPCRIRVTRIGVRFTILQVMWRRDTQFDTFVSYAKEDFETAARLARELGKRGFRVWLDAEQLLPGQSWTSEIQDAISNCLTFIALISVHSVSKVGFVQRELKIALDLVDMVPDDIPFVIPVRLDTSEPSHQRLRDIQWLDLSDGWERALQKLSGSIQLAQRLRRPDAKVLVRAFSMIRLGVVGHATSLLDTLRSRPEVYEAWFCAGEIDVIAVLGVASLSSFVEIVTWIAAQPGVHSARTILAFDDTQLKIRPS